MCVCIFVCVFACVCMCVCTCVCEHVCMLCRMCTVSGIEEYIPSSSTGLTAVMLGDVLELIVELME